jgi:hypothetical protein
MAVIVLLMIYVVLYLLILTVIKNMEYITLEGSWTPHSEKNWILH